MNRTILVHLMTASRDRAEAIESMAELEDLAGAGEPDLGGGFDGFDGAGRGAFVGTFGAPMGGHVLPRQAGPAGVGPCVVARVDDFAGCMHALRVAA